jgi:hypothetical protein
VAFFKNEFFLKVICYREYYSISACTNVSLIITICSAIKFHTFKIKFMVILT